MKIIKPNVEIILNENSIDTLKKIERCGRLCYHSEDRITDTSYISFIQNIIKWGHLSVIEHGFATAIIKCDRGVSHELVRHRIGASYSQSSTRYINYKEGIEVIEPCFWKDDRDKFGQYVIWTNAMDMSERAYKLLIEAGATPEQARTVLPNSLATEIACTYNFREWIHILDLRCSKRSHPQIREVMLIALKKLNDKIPIIFDNLVEKYKEELLPDEKE